MSKIIDLSHVIAPDTGNRSLKMQMIGADEVNQKVVRLENQWYIMHNIEIVSHIGTHIEMPYHLLKDGMDLSNFPLETLHGEAVVLRLRGFTPGTAIPLEGVQESAEKAGGIRSGDIVLCDLGLAEHYGTDAYSHPHFSTAALEWLVEAGMKMMAVDASGIELPGNEEHVNHHVILDRNIPLIENLANIHNVTKDRVQVYAFPIAVKGLESFPLRVVAFE